MKKRIFSVVLVGFLLTTLPLFGIQSAKAEQIVYYPGQTTLGVQNAVFGSRFDLNFHLDPAKRKCWTSTRGAMMDDKTSFIVATHQQGTVERFPPSDQYYKEYGYIWIDLTPTSQIMGGAHLNGNGEIILYNTMKIISPFGPTTSLDDPGLAASISPYFNVEISLYNPTNTVQYGNLLTALDYATGYRQVGDTKIIYYQTGNDGGGVRALAIKDSGVSWGIGDGIFDYFSANYRLPNSNCGGSSYNAGGFAIPYVLQPGQVVTKTLVYAAYNGNYVMNDQRSGRGLKFYYTKFFASLEDVINHAFANWGNTAAKANSFAASIQTGNRELDFITSQAIHSYFASTWLVYDPADGNPRYYVSEGNCQFLSTIDVAFETALFEAKYIPWALKIQLEEWSEYVRYDGYGVYVQHDMGIGNQIYSNQAYPADMKVEENTNYISILFLYWMFTGDSVFIKSKMPLVRELMVSLQRRDTNGNGIVDTAAGRTTVDYDMGRTAIGDATENVYIGIKQFFASLAAERMEKAFGNSQSAASCRQMASQICATLKDAYSRFGYLPVSLSAGLPGWGDQTIVNFEGLVPAFLTGMTDPLIDDLLCACSPSHVFALIACKTSYGYKLCSSGPVTWLSKTFDAKIINNFLIARGYYAYEDSILTDAKAMLVRSDLGFTDCWNIDNGSMNFLTLYLYPRGVSSVALANSYPDLVNLLYSNYLKRDPDPGGYQAHLSALRSGALSVNQATQNMRHSQEYAVSTPFYIAGKKCTGYVDFAFVYWFGHHQDREGHDMYVNKLISWEMSDGDVWWEFYRASVIIRAYRELLFRDPDPGGYAAYMNAMRSGMTEHQLRESIMGSEEYRQKHP